MKRVTNQRGTSIIEATISLGIMTVGLLGMMHMQVLAVRSNQVARSMAVASSLARDLAENAARWDYNDTRLTALGSVQNLDASTVKDKLDLGRDTAVTQTSAKPQFGEVTGDTNATTAGALGTYEGESADVDRDGKLDFNRYWTVFNYDSDSDGTAEGKLIVIVIRWKEPGFGMRQIVTTSFRYNEQVFAL
jgi:type IV pilus modification protein PilV